MYLPSRVRKSNVRFFPVKSYRILHWRPKHRALGRYLLVGYFHLLSYTFYAFRKVLSTSKLQTKLKIRQYKVTSDKDRGSLRQRTGSLHKAVKVIKITENKT